MTKFIVVTGVSKGIGRAAANGLADEGRSVIGGGLAGMFLSRHRQVG